MSLYADTSVLIKRYVHENGSEQVCSLFDKFPTIGTAVLTQVEMASTMSKAVRLGWVDEPEIETAWQDFISHWSSFIRLPNSAVIMEHATALIWRHGLRAYDAVHLASAMIWKDMTGDEVTFACYDQHLAEAAQREGLQTWPG